MSANTTGPAELRRVADELSGAVWSDLVASLRDQAAAWEADRARSSAARALLSELEWIIVDDRNECPWCRQNRDFGKRPGHAANCLLAATIRSFLVLGSGGAA